MESLPAQHRLSFDIESVDALFPGFVLGDLAVLHGSPAVLSLALRLCVRAQLPRQLGGLETNVLFIDGGNRFRLYEVSRIAQLHKLDPREVLEHIFISRAFTAYQMTALILEELAEAVAQYHSNLIVLSDFAGLYLDKDVPSKEAKDVFSQLTSYLSRFVEEHRVMMVIACCPHPPSDRNLFFKMLACGRATVAISVKPYRQSQQFCLEKHQTLAPGRIAVPSESMSLTTFIEA
jgi:hypothetical protein